MSSSIPPPVESAPTQAIVVAPAVRRGRALLCLLLMVSCATCADLLLKEGALVSHPPGSQGLSPLGNLLSIYTITGILFHIAGLGAWLYTLRSLPLMLAYSFTAVQQCMIVVGAWLLLGEQIGPLRWVGIGLVFAGVLALVPEIAAADSIEVGEAH